MCRIQFLKVWKAIYANGFIYLSFSSRQLFEISMRFLHFCGSWQNLNTLHFRLNSVKLYFTFSAIKFFFVRSFSSSPKFSRLFLSIHSQLIQIKHNKPHQKTHLCRHKCKRVDSTEQANKYRYDYHESRYCKDGRQ